MRIAQLVIKNFRGIAETSLKFAGHTVLIGDNNSGKSTVLEAIDLVLGPDRINRAAPIDEHDFYAGRYRYYADDVLSPVKHAVLAARQRLIQSGKSHWSLAVLVKSRDMMLKVSACLGTASPRLPEVAHDVLIDPEGPALAAIFIGGLLEGAENIDVLQRTMLLDLIGHIRGRGGGEINNTNLELVRALTKYLETGQIRGTKRTALIGDIAAIAVQRLAMNLSGDPERDWLDARRIIDGATHEKLKVVADDARYIRLLNRGTQLREELGSQWRATGSYAGAKSIVAAALVQEHFSASTRSWDGVNVMTIHKAKGKEFDEVIVFEGAHAGRLLRNDPTDRDVEQARLALRVAVTRSRSRTLLLTPNWAQCPLL